jgi:hypothetical protein
VRILQETASCRLATPITVRFDQLRPGEGYDPRKETTNFGPVWQGGEWHIRDITNTMTKVAFFLLKHAAQNREHWLQRFYEIEKEAVRPRKSGELFAFVVPEARHRPDLLHALIHADIDFDAPLPFTAGGVRYPAGTPVIKMAQPYSGFVRAVVEPRKYPDLRDATGRPIPPYDVTAHTLSVLMDVPVVPIYQPFTYRLPKPSGMNECSGFGELGGKLALYKSHVPAMDEGWTRWVLEQEHYKYASLLDDEIRRGDLVSRYDTIIIPDQLRPAILNGHRKGMMPDEYTGGLGEQGVKALREFVEAGGTLVCLNRASDFAIEQFKLPVRDVVDGLPRTDFYVPGSILRVELDTSNPIAAGLPKESMAWVENSPVFEIKSDPLALVRVKIVASYPKDRDPVLSGWLLGGDRVKGKAALVEVGLGKGRIILFGFRPQYRGQSLATYPLFFNAIANR